MTDSLNEAPGISVAALIDRASDGSLRRLIDPEFLGVIEALDPGLATGEKFRELVKRLVEPRRLLLDRRARNGVLDLLPLAKAQELAQRLQVPATTSIYEHLRDATATKEVHPVLLSFFGVVDDLRAPTHASASSVQIAPNYSLFEHQRVAARRVQSVLAVHPRKVVLHMPTGAGKTRTAMHIVAEHLTVGGPSVVCWLAQSAELLEQAAVEFERSWKALGNRPLRLHRFWDQNALDLEELQDGVLVAGLGKLHSASTRETNLIQILGDRISLVVVDEAHQSIAPTYRSLIEGLYSKRPKTGLLGLTATPGRTWRDVDADETLAKFFSHTKVVLEVDGYRNPVDYLVKEGYLARATFRSLSSGIELRLTADELVSATESADFPDHIIKRLDVNVDRNIAIVRAIEALCERHRRIVVFGASVRHAHLLSALLASRGRDSAVITAETDPSLRDRIIRRFKGAATAPMVVCNFGVLTTGFDAPATSAAVIARPTKSLVLYSQMVGRAIRGPKAGGNAESEIVTVVDRDLPGFGSVADAFCNWEDIWNG